MSFKFVDNECIDRKTRRLIRSHVAKGKNLGKTLHRQRSRTKVPGQAGGTLATTTTTDRVNASAEEALMLDIPTLPAPERMLSRSMATPSVNAKLSPAAFPLGLTSQSRRSLEKFLSTIYDPVEYQTSVVFEACRTTWIQYLFQDEAYFHCNVAISLIMEGRVIARPLLEVNQEVLQRAADAYRLVTDRLSGHDALSDSTLAVVMALIYFECLGGRYQQGLMHFQGLQKLVHLRGGIPKLQNSCPDIAHKIFRFDLELALLLGTEVWCPVAEVPGHGVLLDMRQGLPQEGSGSGQPPHGEVGQILKDILLDALSLACQLNTANQIQRGPTEYRFHQAVILLGHRLINLSTFVDSRLDSDLERKLHLGLTTFVATFFIGPTHKISDFKLLANHIRTAAEASLSEDKDCMEVMLWALSMARADMFDEVGGEWLTRTVANLASSLEIHTRENFERMLHRYPWVHGLHAESAQGVWDELCLHSIRIETDSDEGYVQDAYVSYSSRPLMRLS